MPPGWDPTTASTVLWLWSLPFCLFTLMFLQAAFFFPKNGWWRCPFWIFACGTVSDLYPGRAVCRLSFRTLQTLFYCLETCSSRSLLCGNPSPARISPPTWSSLRPHPRYARLFGVCVLLTFSCYLLLGCVDLRIQVSHYFGQVSFVIYLRVFFSVLFFKNTDHVLPSPGLWSVWSNHRLMAVSSLKCYCF